MECPSQVSSRFDDRYNPALRHWLIRGATESNDQAQSPYRLRSSRPPRWRPKTRATELKAAGVDVTRRLAEQAKPGFDAARRRHQMPRVALEIRAELS